VIAELGHFAAIVALLLALLMALGAAAARALGGSGSGDAGDGGDRVMLAVSRRAAPGVFLLTLLAGAALCASFALNDFSVRYVAQHSHSTLALAYRLAAVWGSHEGSMLLWVLTLAGWTMAVARFSRALAPALALRVLAVLGAILAGLLLFVLLGSNPFERLLPPPADGRDLNALLQDPGMLMHPPALYLGYVGFAVPFATVVAVLWVGRADAADWRWLRPWTLAAWAALTIGIVLGSRWAYRVLGWGGWWFWDPVENASLLPWLAGLALLHVLPAAEVRAQFRRWAVLLAIATFGLSLVGTFLVRSGAITSVHAFASDPRRGVFILALLALSMGCALLLFAARGQRLREGPPFAPVSRESMLLANALLFSVATASVLLATLYPMLLEALGAARISVGAPYFEAVLGPLLAPAVFLMAAGPLARWHREQAGDLARRLRWALGCALAAALGTLAFDRAGAGLAFGVALGVWCLAGVAAAAIGARQPARPDGPPRRHVGGWGVLLAHAGVGVFVLGLTVTRSLEVHHEAALRPGDTVTVGPHQLRLQAVRAFDAANHRGERAAFVLLSAGREPALLRPEVRQYRTQDVTVSSPAIDATPWRDVYVALGERVGPDTWAVRVQHKPLMAWIWAGFSMMGAGAALAALGGRYRRQPVRSAPGPVDAAGAVHTPPLAGTGQA
jgi:cytochrome c-type biogenesis protein CcmF